MKKILLIVSVMMLSISAWCQQEVGSFTIQPKVGLNIANYTDADGSDPRIGLAAGFEFEYQASTHFGLAFGLLYSAQGSKASETNYVTKTKVVAQTDYVNLPIMANIYIVKGLAFKLGLQPAFNVKDKYKASVSDQWSNASINTKGNLSDFDIDVKSFDFSIPIGLSYEFCSGFVVDARYNLGVTKMAKDSDSRNSVWQFTVGYKFKL
ncbi:MAG: PorT family protein [Bacteroidaceae bacterium]|nr:PorT family protein [Bacteroidaceae bacterium]